jgi:hypothetical protein
MALLTVWPTDAADGSVANEARWRKMARLWSPTGVRAGVGAEMVPTLAALNLTVKAGACWIDGHYCELAADQVLPVTADGLAVVRFDPVANTAELLWRAGVGVVPTMNPAGVWELPIAVVGSSFMADRRMFVMDNGLAAFSSFARDLSLPSPPDGVEVFHRDTQSFSHRLGGAWRPLKKLLYQLDFDSVTKNFTAPVTTDLFFSNTIAGAPGTLPFPVTVTVAVELLVGFGSVVHNSSAWISSIYNGTQRQLTMSQSMQSPILVVDATTGIWTYQVPANSDWTFKVTLNTSTNGGVYAQALGTVSIFTA